jgi:hypothetical protein
MTYPDEGHTSNADRFRLTYYETQGRVRVMPSERADPRIGYDLRYLDVDTNDPALPSALSDTSVAFGMGIAEKDGWLFGLSVGVGYAAAGAFNDGNGWYGKADLAFGKQLDDVSSVGVVINYDGNRSFMPDIPLPGFAYRRRIDEKLLLAIGFPFASVEWKPIEKLTLNLSYFIPDDGEIKVDYEILKNLGLFGSFAGRRDAFHYDELPNSSDRLIYVQRRAEVGVRWSPVEQASLLVAGGYLFDQEFNVGWDTRDMDRVAKPSDEPYVRIGLEMRF